MGRAVPPLVVHVIHALRVGGMENGVVNLINHMSPDRYRHAIVCMTDYSDFRLRLRRADVEVIAMNRDNVPLWRTYARLTRLLRRMRPAIVHSRNLSGLDALIPALLAGVRVRIHGEHGRDADDLDGLNPRNLRLRRLFRPLVRHYCVVSEDLRRYVVERVSVAPTKISQIYNGVDTAKFRPVSPDAAGVLDREDASEILIGTVGRLQGVKDQLTLVHAYYEARRSVPDRMANTRLVIVGDGPCRTEIVEAIARFGIQRNVSLLGERHDVPEILRALDLFVLPSLNEGISNTILEAMASGIPVLATRVGGNPELVLEDRTGRLVAPGDVTAMAASIVDYVGDETLRRSHGRAGRQRIEDKFSLQSMVNSYAELYDVLLARPHHRSGIVPEANH